MAKKTGRCRQARPPQQTQTNSASHTEPVMRRWPHPVVTASPQEDATLHYITCALSYQNQLLADIKVLLERMANETAGSGTSGAASAGAYDQNQT